MTKEDLLKEAHKVLDWASERAEHFTNQLSESVNQRMQFTEGVALGLLYGIIGNLVVSHYYEVFEGITLARYDSLFWSNLTAFLIGLGSIIVLTIIFRRRLKKLKGYGEQIHQLTIDLNELKTERQLGADLINEFKKMEDDSKKTEEKRTEE